MHLTDKLLHLNLEHIWNPPKQKDENVMQRKPFVYNGTFLSLQ